MRTKSKPERQQSGNDENFPDGLPEHFFTNGELDLRNVTGAEMKKFFQAVNSGSEYED